MIPIQGDLQLWNKHAEMLPWIREYRNKSAHELTPISHNDMDNICKPFFKERIRYYSEIDTATVINKVYGYLEKRDVN